LIPFAMPLGRVYALKAAGVFAAIAIVVASRRAQHPFDRLGPANQVTGVRALLVALVAGFIGEPPSGTAALAATGLGAAATALDGVDGWLARRTRMASAFGARFDMEIDALLIQVLAILVWQIDKAGVWVLASGLLRYGFVAAGWIWPWLRQPLFASLRRKTICVVQIAGLLVALLPVVPRTMSSAAAAVSLAALAYSFLVDILWLWRRRLGA
jgi:phosphatidylglycerophosphate synthase